MLQSKRFKKKMSPLLFYELFEGGEVLFEGLASFVGGFEEGVGFAADEAFLAGDVALLLEGACVTCQIAVGELKELFERLEVGLVVDHQHGHDAKPCAALEGFVQAQD